VPLEAGVRRDKEERKDDDTTIDGDGGRVLL
jgi:hypothetical protein